VSRVLGRALWIVEGRIADRQEIELSRELFVVLRHEPALHQDDCGLKVHPDKKPSGPTHVKAEVRAGPRLQW
jgi:hypothetical protein